MVLLNSHSKVLADSIEIL